MEMEIEEEVWENENGVLVCHAYARSFLCCLSFHACLVNCY
jgi:hypothetical protein